MNMKRDDMLNKSYFPQNGIWLRGNTHSHTTVSDGQYTPTELAELYGSKGYDFLSMTDHNVYVSHHELSEESLIQITGVEHDIEYSTDKCTHIVGLGAYGHTETNYLCRRYSKEELSDQQLIDMMSNDAQFVSIAHPIWSRMQPEELLCLNNYNAIEVYNSGTEHLCHGGGAEIIWDYLLQHGKKIYATAVDDVHVTCDLFGGWIWVKARERTYKAVLEALFEGWFYASSGPIIEDYGMSQSEIYVKCSSCREIHFVTYPVRGKSFFAEDCGSLTEAKYSRCGREEYIRVVCTDHNGHSAWSQPIFFDER